MGEKLDEGLLLDLLEKRRAGKFTGDELLWAADHPEVIRWAMRHPEEAKRLCERNLVTAERKLSPSASYARELGFEVVEGEDVLPTLKSASDLELVFFLEPDDGGCVNGETMRARAKKRNANLGLMDLEVALSDPTKIPLEEGVLCIVFSGTLLRHPDGNLYVACLVQLGDRWSLFSNMVADDWGGSGRLAHCKSA